MSKEVHTLREWSPKGFELAFQFQSSILTERVIISTRRPNAVHPVSHRYPKQPTQANPSHHHHLPPKTTPQASPTTTPTHPAPPTLLPAATPLPIPGPPSSSTTPFSFLLTTNTSPVESLVINTLPPSPSSTATPTGLKHPSGHPLTSPFPNTSTTPSLLSLPSVGSPLPASNRTIPRLYPTASSRFHDPWNATYAAVPEASNLMSRGAVCAWKTRRGGVVVAQRASSAGERAKGVEGGRRVLLEGEAGRGVHRERQVG